MKHIQRKAELIGKISALLRQIILKGEICTHFIGGDSYEADFLVGRCNHGCGAERECGGEFYFRGGGRENCEGRPPGI